MATASMVFDVIARTGGAEGSFRRLSAEADGAGRSFDRLGKAAAGISVLFAAFAVREAAQFETAMTRISTQAGVPIKNIKGLGDALLNLAPKVGTGPEALATSLYHVESAFRTTGISAGKAIDIVQQAAKLSKIGNADLESTTQAIIGVLSSGIKGVKDATDAAAQLNQLVGAGDTTLSAVTKSIATGILPTAHALGLTFKDVSAAIATITDNATPADEAATRLRTTFSLIEKPSKQAYAALSSIGLSSTSLAEDFRKPNGLLVAMEDLKTHLEATYPSSQSTKLSISEIKASTDSYVTSLEQQGDTQKEAIDLGKKYAQSLREGGSAATLQAQTILQAFGGAKSGSTFLTLYEELTRLQSKYKDYGTAAQAAAKFQEAWGNQQKTFKQKLDDLKASWDVFLIKAGNAILPTLKKITDFLSKHPALLHDAALGVLAFAGAWAFLKVANLIGSLGTLAGKIAGVGAASRAAAGDVAALDAAAAGGRTGGAAASVTTLGGAFAKSGLLLGGAAVVGLGALALDIHQIVNDGKVKNLPALDQLAKLIAAGGLTGKGPTLDLGLALSTTPSGNNRKENDTQYLQRTLGSDQAKSAGLSFQGLIKTLQTGSRPAFDTFLASFRQVEFALKGSPDTIQKVGDYLTALYNRYNSARVASHDLTAEQTKAASAAALLSTDVDKLSKTYGVNRGQAGLLAIANQNYRSEVALGRSELTIFGTSLDNATHSGQENIGTIKDQVFFTKQHAEGIAKLTGNQTLASQAFTDGIKALENNATALGFNKGDVDQLINSLIGVKNNENINIVVTAKGTFDWSDPAQQQAYFSATSPNSPAAAFYAAGGLISGPGSGTSDSIPAWLSHGEYVMPAATVKQMGVGFFDSIRQGFAGGGAVSGSGALRSLAAGVPPYAGSEVTDLSQHMAAVWKGFAAKKLATLAASSGSIGGGVQQWIPLVLQVLGMLGQPSSLLTNVLQQMTLESGGNPNAINLWDSNAAIGQPSKGLMQTIDSTFNAYAGPFRGLGIYNPLANIYAGLNYASQTGGIGRLHGTQGYAMGTSSARPGWAKVGERGSEWVHFGGGEKVLPHGQSPQPGPLLHIEHWHGDQTDADGLASQIAAKTRATALARRV